MTDRKMARRKRSTFWILPEPERRELRNFGLLFGVLALVVASLLWYRDNPQSVWVGAAAALLVAVALLLPRVLRNPFIIWMLFARILGFVNSHIILALIFYTLFTAGGAIMRIVRYDPLKRRMHRPAGPENGHSYWSRREQTSLSTDHFERQF